MDLAEKIAKSVVEELTPGARMCFREQQHDGGHDFDLVLPDGSTAALEVTASKDFELERTNAAIRLEKHGGPFIPTLKCRNDWSIHPLPDAPIKRIRAEVDGYLADIEADRLKRFFYDVDGGRYASVRRICEDLSIEAGSVTRWKTPGRICIWLPGAGGLRTSRVAERAVLAEADKQDNRAKLRNAGTAERHLFVLVDQGNYLPWVSLVDEEPPRSPPDLPADVTHLWAAGITRDPRVVVVWRCIESGWEPRQYVGQTAEPVGEVLPAKP